MIKAIVLSLIGSFSLAYGIVSAKKDKSNNFGDILGTVSDFSKGSWDVPVRRDYKTNKKEWEKDISFAERMTGF
ncbi:MAG: hypothetical protein E7289_00360 [Lachnospiraceae bacterium]|nr:hypothetical protein [Lachnospiraceae bacterium]